jgi:hypothetical protein
MNAATSTSNTNTSDPGAAALTWSRASLPETRRTFMATANRFQAKISKSLDEEKGH